MLASNGQRPGVLLAIPVCLGQLPATKNYPAPNGHSAEAEKPSPRLVSDFPILVAHWDPLRNL